MDKYISSVDVINEVRSYLTSIYEENKSEMKNVDASGRYGFMCNLLYSYCSGYEPDLPVLDAFLIIHEIMQQD